MQIKSFIKDKSKISKVTSIIISLALIRTISEPLRLRYYSETSLTFEQIEPFLIGGLVSGVGLLIMTLLSFYKKHRIIIAVGILVIIAMLVVKNIYQL